MGSILRDGVLCGIIVGGGLEGPERLLHLGCGCDAEEGQVDEQ